MERPQAWLRAPPRKPGGGAGNGPRRATGGKHQQIAAPPQPLATPQNGYLRGVVESNGYGSRRRAPIAAGQRLDGKIVEDSLEVLSPATFPMDLVNRISRHFSDSAQVKLDAME